QDAVDDGATVPIYYGSRLARLDINHDEIEALSDQVDEVVEDGEDVTQRERTKGEWSRLEKLVGAAPRLRQVAADLVEHFETRTAMMDGTAMTVAMSRDICVQPCDDIFALRPQAPDTAPGECAIQIAMT